MRYIPIRKEMYISNREKLVKKLLPGSLAIVNSNDEMPRSGDQTFVFRQNSDMFYLSGLFIHTLDREGQPIDLSGLHQLLQLTGLFKVLDD